MSRNHEKEKHVNEKKQYVPWHDQLMIGLDDNEELAYKNIFPCQWQCCFHNLLDRTIAQAEDTTRLKENKVRKKDNVAYLNNFIKYLSIQDFLNDTSPNS